MLQPTGLFSRFKRRIDLNKKINKSKVKKAHETRIWNLSYSSPRLSHWATAPRDSKVKMSCNISILFLNLLFFFPSDELTCNLFSKISSDSDSAQKIPLESVGSKCLSAVWNFLKRSPVGVWRRIPAGANFRILIFCDFEKSQNR